MRYQFVEVTYKKENIFRLTCIKERRYNNRNYNASSFHRKASEAWHNEVCVYIHHCVHFFCSWRECGVWILSFFSRWYKEQDRGSEARCCPLFSQWYGERGRGSKIRRNQVAVKRSYGDWVSGTEIRSIRFGNRRYVYFSLNSDKLFNIHRFICHFIVLFQRSVNLNLCLPIRICHILFSQLGANHCNFVNINKCIYVYIGCLTMHYYLFSFLQFHLMLYIVT